MLADGRMDTRNAALYTGLTSGGMKVMRHKKRGPKWIKSGNKIYYFKNVLDKWIANNDAHRFTGK